ncbi:MAG: hypothetical protein KDB21_20740 [Acidimicrobiales bacterium]|nr:hypothetical protein [Acidimicrobiales bacterium]
MQPPVVVLGVARSSLGAIHGRWASTPPAHLLGQVIAELVGRSGLDPAALGGIVVGCTTPVGAQADNVGRQAAVHAGLSELSAITLDRHDATPLAAVQVAASLSAAHRRPFVAAAVDITSIVPPGAATVRDYGRPTLASLPDGLLAEREAQRDGLRRAELQAVATRSRSRAAASGDLERDLLTGRADVQRSPIRSDEVPPEPTDDLIEAMTGQFEADGIVSAATMASLADGAAAVLVMAVDDQPGSGPSRAARTSAAARTRVVATVRAVVTAAADPDEPIAALVAAARQALDDAGRGIDEIDRLEIDERFAVFALGTARRLGVGPEVMNPDGGALALGSAPAVEGLRMMCAAVAGLGAAGGGTALLVCGGHGGQASAAVIDVAGDVPRDRSSRPDEPESAEGPRH